LGLPSIGRYRPLTERQFRKGLGVSWLSQKHESPATLMNLPRCPDYLTELDMPGFRLHRLRGDKRNLWSVRVSANWRITFEFEKGDAYILDLEDYH
jgi:hypothetical protein